MTGITALLLIVALDAPAPAPSPKPKPHVVATPQPPPSEPFDLEGWQTDPPTGGRRLCVEANDCNCFEGSGDTFVACPPPILSTPVAPPTPIRKANHRGFHMDSQTGALATATAAGGTEVSPFFWINTDGPIAMGNEHSIGRLGARLGLTTSPGATLNALDVNTYNALEADFWGGYVIGVLKDVETSIFVEGGFASRMKGPVSPEPLRRLARSAGIGARFDARKSSAYVLAKLGFDEATITCRPVPGLLAPNCYGFHSGLALMMRGQVPLYKNAVLFTGDVSLSIGGSASWLDRTDILRFGLALDPLATIKELKAKPVAP